jgi:hypothetical protein
MKPVQSPRASLGELAIPRWQNGSESDLLLSMDDEDIADRPPGPIKINAFDLINMVNGAAMNRMFQRKPLMERATQFTSQLAADAIISRLSEVFTLMPDVEFRVYQTHYEIRACQRNIRGTTLMRVQLFEMTPTLHLVESSKLKGDIFAYRDFFEEMKIRVLNKPDASSDNTLYDSNNSSQIPRNNLNIVVSRPDNIAPDDEAFYNPDISPDSPSVPRGKDKSNK